MGKISNFYIMPHPPIVVPEVGRGEERKIKQTYDAYNEIAEQIAAIKPDTIIIITPHGPLFSNAIAVSAGESIYGDMGRFNAPEVQSDLQIDISLVEEIVNYSREDNILAAKITEDNAEKYNVKYELDHGALIPLYFINKKFSDYKIIHITYGMLPKIKLYEFGMNIKKAVEDSNVNAVLIASGDLSHKLSEDGPYGYSPYGEIFDKEIISLLETGDVLGVFNIDPVIIEEAGECGLRSFYIMLGAMEGCSIKGNLLSYEGTFGVGYSVMEFILEKSDKSAYNLLLKDIQNKIKTRVKNADPHVRLACESLTNFLINGDYMDVPPYVTDEMKNTKRGVFVTLKELGALRGCVGTFLPTTENVCEEIIKNAVSAGIYDSRFLPVQLEELDNIDFSVDVLTEPQKASMEELDPKKYGIIVKSGPKLGLLLPDLEGVDTIEEQINIALQKGGISTDEEYTIEKFEVIRHS
ncbi:MAG: AmmeMemoRadiSam system protein A [Natronincolaceae bacterium]|nr:AmmeMemoRadiSam system protein A [Bacillota bacterium]NLK90931.1 AmmeMemoRadiSam system protein A [Clostridiales bacterium]